jgi:hypothetical protein
MILPIDYNVIRATIVSQAEASMGVTCVLQEPETTGAPRPALPYLTFKFTSPAVKAGWDEPFQERDADGVLTGNIIWCGQRRVVASFQCYGNTHEEAYNILSGWQLALNQFGVGAAFAEAGIAICGIGSVKDITMLINNAYEGRAHLDAEFGVSFSVVEQNVGLIAGAVVSAPILTGDDESTLFTLDVQF